LEKKKKSKKFSHRENYFEKYLVVGDCNTTLTFSHSKKEQRKIPQRKRKERGKRYIYPLPKRRGEKRKTKSLGKIYCSK